MGIDERKNALRENIKERLKKLNEWERDSKSLVISKNLKSFFQQNIPHYQSQTRFILGAFAPIQAEVDLFKTPFGNEALKWAFPDYEDGKMVFRQCSYEDLEVTAVFGVELSSPPKSYEIVTPEVLLIPGLAFTRSGVRLGRGKGFYDRYLESYQGMKVGLCYEEQIEVDVPYDEHDIQVDFVVSDSGIFRK